MLPLHSQEVNTSSLRVILPREMAKSSVDTFFLSGIIGRTEILRDDVCSFESLQKLRENA
jgi:hypothetical protein